MLIYQNPTIVQNSLGIPEGLTLSRSAAQQISIAPGRTVVARSSGIRQIATRTTNLAKNLNATWTQGNNQGGRASAVALTANTIYHVYLLMDANGNVDAYFDTSATAANRPAGWDARMIGAVLTDDSNNITPFSQKDGYFDYNPALMALNTANLSTSSSNVITLPAPNETQVYGTVAVSTTTASGNLNLSSENDPSTSAPYAVIPFNTIQVFYWTISGNRMRIHAAQANSNVVLRVRGFIHARGSQG